MEKAVFLKEEGDSPKNRVWNFLIVYSEYDYSMKDIARYSDVGYTTLKVLWKEFKEKKIVVQTRTVGKAKMYKLNVENPVVSTFIDYYWTVVSAVVKRENKSEEEETMDQSYHSSPVTIPISAKHV